jgi:GH35 family endo-1,4-beta-xylanase
MEMDIKTRVNSIMSTPEQLLAKDKTQLAADLKPKPDVARFISDLEAGLNQLPKDYQDKLLTAARETMRTHGFPEPQIEDTVTLATDSAVIPVVQNGPHSGADLKSTRPGETAAKEEALYGPAGSFTFSEIEKRAQRQVEQQKEQRELLATGRTGNLLNGQFKLEGKSLGDADPAKLDPNAQPGELKISLKRPINAGEQLAFSQSIDYRFTPTTPEQKQWQQEHPNGPELGHIIHVHFRAKTGDESDHKMTVQLMDSNPPYQQSMSERVDLSKHVQKDNDGYTTYDFYAVAPDTKGDGRLNLKFNVGREQPAGEISIKDIGVQEVTSAPGLNPAEVLKAGGNDSHHKNGSDHFMFGSNVNQLTERNVAVPDDVKAKANQELIEKYQRDNALSPEQQEKYLQKMKEMGINTVTIPIYWNQIEKEPGKLDYSRVDHMIDLAKKYGMQVKLHPIVWASCYPNWADQAGPNGIDGQHTKDVIKQHIDDIVQHFGKNVDYLEVNEMNSTDLLQQETFDQNGKKHMEMAHNGLTDWVRKEGSAAVINQVDQWIREDLAKYNSGARLFENEYVLDGRTQSNDEAVSRDPNRPDAFGIQMHQFNGNDPALRIAQELQDRKAGGTPNYISEITVQTRGGDNIDETRLSPEVTSAVKKAQQYRESHGLKPLTDQERRAQEMQAEQLLIMYRLAGANQSTIGVSLWDFTDKNGWNGSTGGVLDSNLDPKVSYFALQEFIARTAQRAPVNR